MEKCNNCERVIGNLERPYVFRDQVGCVECWHRLDAQARAFAALSTPPKPIEDPPKPTEGRAGGIVQRVVVSGHPPPGRKLSWLSYCALASVLRARITFTPAGRGPGY